MIKLDSPIPLYHQLKILLARRIAGGEWQPGDMLPTEEQLCQLYGVSRSTARQALRELELAGTIVRNQGKGTFVAQAKLSHSPEPHLSLTTVLREQGLEPGWQVLSAEWLPTLPPLASDMGLDADTPVFRLRRLRLANDELVGYHVAHVSPLAAAAIDKNQFESGGSLDYLSSNGFLSGTEAHRTIEAVAAPNDVARLLDVSPGSPLLSIRRRLFAQDGVLLETLRALYRGDRFQYQIRPPGAAHEAPVGD